MVLGGQQKPMISREIVQTSLENYLKLFPDEKKELSLFSEQVLSGDDIFSRKNFTGHVTASGLVISPDKPDKKVLAIFHNTLQKYLQPGGHVEMSDQSLEGAAQREIVEETGLQNPILHSWHGKSGSPLLIDAHPIPENKGKQEDAHYHHDFLFVFSTEDATVSLDQNEVSGFMWRDINTVLQNDSNMAKALRKMKEFEIL